MADNIKNEVNQFVIFTLGEEKYGVDINKVREIITMQSITLVPGSSGLIEGIINLRGYVIPIFNIKRKFNLAEGEFSAQTRIVVIEVSNNTLGIIVDGVSEVLRIPGHIIESPSSIIAASIDTNYIEGIAKMEDKLIIMLDLEKILSAENKLEMAKAI